MEKLIDLSTTIKKPFARMLFSVFQHPIESLMWVDLDAIDDRIRKRLIGHPDS